jgi:hypothetical protein
MQEARVNGSHNTPNFCAVQTLFLFLITMTPVGNIGASLTGVAKRVRVLVLPHAKPKDDVVDWAKAGGTRDQLDALLDKAQEWKPLSDTFKHDQRTADEKAKAKSSEDEILDALAKTEGLDYARQRRAAAKDLGVSARDIDEQVNKRANVRF